MSANNPSYGTKVTDPTSTLEESAGPIASDSLAAESNAFSQNRNGAPQGAKRLDPASNAEARKEDDCSKEQRYGNAAGGQSNGLAEEDSSLVGGSGVYPTSGGVNGGSGSGSGSGSAGTAPSYVNSQHVNVGGPKGQNLTEGGFKSDDSKNMSFKSDIGSKNDPSRLAELKMQREKADAAGDSGMPRQKGTTGDNTYDALDSDTTA